VPIHAGGPGPIPACIAAILLGNLTSPSHAASKNEAFRAGSKKRSRRWTRWSREVLALRHFEELSNTEAASLLGIQARRREQALCARLGEAEADSRDVAAGFAPEES